MADIKISAAPDVGALQTTDRFPVVRQGSTNAYSTTVNSIKTAVGSVGGGGPIVATPVCSSAAEAGHVLKASAGTCYFVDAVNFTSTACLLVILDAAAVPTNGATVSNVIDAIPLPPNGRATYNPSGAAAACANGIVAFASTNLTSPWTAALTGVSAYFTGMVQ